MILLICWQLISYYPGYTFSDAGAGSFTFPDVATHQHYPAFLVCTQAQSMNLSNATVVATFTVEADPGTEFRYGGEGNWNIGPMPASARFFFSAVAGYNNAGTGSTNYWFNSNWVEVTNGTATLIATFNPADWTDAGGCNECPPIAEANFWYAVANVREVGIAYGGGDFYDIGIATSNGSASFSLDYFGVTPKFKNYKQCFSSE